MEKTTDATRRWSGPITLAKSAHTGPILRAGRALKCLYLVTRSLDPTGVGRARWMMRWKPALKASPITIGDPIPGSRNLVMKTPETPLARSSRFFIRQRHQAGVSRIGRWVGPRSELLVDQVTEPAAVMAEAWEVSSRSTAWPSMRVRVAPMHM